MQLPELRLQGQSQPCTGKLLGHEVSKVRASVKRDKCEEWWSLAKLDLVTCQFLTNSKIIKKQTNQIRMYNKAAFIVYERVRFVALTYFVDGECAAPGDGDFPSVRL